MFRKSRAYVERRGWGWYILSALHGLIEPDAVLEPYERSLVGARRAELLAWSSNVLRALDAVLPQRAKLVLLAGRDYSRFLVPALMERGHQIEQPLEGLSLGRRIAFLDDDATEAASHPNPANSTTRGRDRSPARADPTDRLSPSQWAHYEVARSFEGFFTPAEFATRYRERYPKDRAGPISPSDYRFNRESKRDAASPRFLWWDGRNSYVFVGLDGAPKDFALPVTGTAQPIGHSSGMSGSQTGIPSPTRGRASSVQTDLERARVLAERLHRAFLPSGRGIFGEHQMPEDILPPGLTAGSREQLLFLMLTVSVDYMRDALELWRCAREAWADVKTRYLFEPQRAAAAGYDQVEHDLKACGVARRTRRDSGAWFTIARTLSDKCGGDPRAFLEDCGYRAPVVLRRLEGDRHLEHGRWRPDFPLLRGPKIAPLWLRMLRDNAAVEFAGLDEVSIPVDVHVLRATLCTGAVHGRFAGSMTEIFEDVRRVWRGATRGLRLPDGRAMVALDVDEALWTLSRLGCSKRGNGRLGACSPGCPAAPGCVVGTVLIKSGCCEFDTRPGS